MGVEAWKAIRIPQSTRAWRSWHAPIMPDSPTVATVFPPAASAASRTFSCLFSPTRFHEDPEYIVYIHEAVVPYFEEGLAVRIELCLEVEVSEGSALAIADPRLFHPHRHVVALRELIQDAAIRLGSTQRGVDTRTSHSLDEKENRMFPGAVWLRDDGANPRSAADDVIVKDVQGLAPVPRKLLQRHGKDEAPAGA